MKRITDPRIRDLLVNIDKAKQGLRRLEGIEGDAAAASRAKLSNRLRNLTQEMDELQGRRFIAA